MTASTPGPYAIFLTNGSNHNTISNTNATANVDDAIQFLTNCSFNTISNTTVTSTNYTVVFEDNSNNDSIVNSNVTATNLYGVSIWTSSNSTVSGTFASAGSYAIYLDPTSNLSTIINSTGTSSSSGGIYINTSNNNSVINSTAFGSFYGLYLYLSNKTLLSNVHYYNNSYDFFVVGASSFNMSTSLFDNPLGNFVNFTNLSINDSVSTGNSYFINWSKNTSAIPSGYSSFAQTFVNITNLTGTPSIGWLAFNWYDSELGSTYNDSGFNLFRYNATWADLNSTPNTVADTLTLSSVSSFGVFGILQQTNCPVINSSGIFTQTMNYVGAPNNASPLTNFTCVKIAASNVTFNCNGYNITNNGTGGTTYGILLNGSLTNVTVRNCPSISNYTNDIYVYQTNNSNITNDTVYNATIGGIYLVSSNNSALNNLVLSSNGYGFYILSSSNDTFTNSVAASNSGTGFYVTTNSNNETFININAISNATVAFYLDSSNNDIVINTTGAANSSQGIYIQTSSNSVITNFTGTSNTNNGIFISGGSNNTFTNCSGAANTSQGFYFSTTSNDTLINSTGASNTSYGLFLLSSSNNTLINAIGTSNSSNGIYLTGSSNNNTFTNCSGASNTSMGIDLQSSSNNVFANVTGTSNASGYGIYLYSGSNNNTFTNSSGSATSGAGICLNSSSNNTINNSAVFSSFFGLLINSSNVSLLNMHYYNNSRDFAVNGTSKFNMSTSIFDNPLGNFVNFTNLSVNDSVGSGESYYINWSSNTSAIPFGYFSFAQTFVNITNLTGPTSIDWMAFNWYDTELGATYNETLFNLFSYNSTWADLNSTPDTAGDTLALSAVSSFGIFGILQQNQSNCPVISHPETYTQSTNFSGAPNDASPLINTACVLIASSNVIFDCNGYAITNNGTGGVTHGILLNGSLTNVTVKNCPNVSGYSVGIHFYQSNNSIITNSTAYNNSVAGIYISSSDFNNLTNDTAINNTNNGIYLVSSFNNTLSGNNFTLNTNYGVSIDSISANNTFASNLICRNALDMTNQGASNNGTLDRCDSFLNWNESSHFGCTYSCSSLWQRFFGDANGTIILGDLAHNVYSWNGSAYNLFFTASNAVINWLDLQAIGRTAAGAPSSNDFTELDNTFGSSAFPDNITTMYSTDGTNPKQTLNYTVFGSTINYVPVANSTNTNTSFKTGILWDMSDGGTEYSNAFNQSTVWMVRINSSDSDTYGTYDFLGQIPYTLATTNGSSSISIYLELK